MTERSGICAEGDDVIIAIRAKRASIFNGALNEETVADDEKYSVRTDRDQWCAVEGVCGDLGAALGERDELIWLADLARTIRGFVRGLRWIEAWRSHGGAEYAVGVDSDGDHYLVFRGRRRQWNGHSVGWNLSADGIDAAHVWSTDPTSVPESMLALVGAQFGSESAADFPWHRHELPRCEGWVDPVATGHAAEAEELWGARLNSHIDAQP